jgi:pyridoxal biosynthesis lyase PdxS
MIKGKAIEPVSSTKILGVIMDSELRYKQQVARAATKGLIAVMALRRLQGLPLAIVRRLFEDSIVPVVDYASYI